MATAGEERDRMRDLLWTSRWLGGRFGELALEAVNAAHDAAAVNLELLRLARAPGSDNYTMHQLHRANLAPRVASRQIAARPRSVEQRD